VAGSSRGSKRLSEIDRRGVDLGIHEVVVVRGGLSHRLRYVVLSLTAWAVALLDFDASGDAPRYPYRVVVRDKNQGTVLYEEGVFHGAEAFDAAQEFSAAIQRLGVEDFVYKKSHGWRID